MLTDVDSDADLLALTDVDSLSDADALTDVDSLIDVDSDAEILSLACLVSSNPPLVARNPTPFGICLPFSGFCAPL